MSGFDTVTTVPSVSGRAEHSLGALVAEMVGVTRGRHGDPLTPAPGAAALGRNVSAERYTSSALRGLRLG
ncbi:hypothetical protein AB0D27_12870 [Streptomyces sp. NPDC048415]|uniref:hypothetical protein n=1 Tax=Streptomyces sp. NPDC048415 TaxID=3154822 RepID=UPI003413D3FE